MALGKRRKQSARLGRLIVPASVAACVLVFAAILLAPTFAPSFQPTPAQGAAPAVSDSAPTAGNSSPNTPAKAVSADEGAEAVGEPAGEKAREDDAAVFEPGFMLTLMEEGVSGEEALRSLQSVPGLEGVSVEEVIDNVLKVKLPASLSVREAAELAGQADAVSAAQPNYRYYPVADGTSSLAQDIATPSVTGAANDASSALTATSLGDALGLQAVTNDPYYNDQWHLASVKAPAAWKALKAAGATRTTVAVLDAGFYTGHEDLVGNVATSYDATTMQMGIPTGSSSVVGHGTHCAGIIAATANNGRGITGVAGNFCKVLPVRVQDSYGYIYSSYLARAYSYLVSKKGAYNIRVANMSLGADVYSSVSRSTDSVVFDAIQKGRNAGIVSVVAACNGPSYYLPYYAWPSDFDNVVSVIALSRAGNGDGVERASYSNYNVSGQVAKTISAPGTSIKSLDASWYSSSYTSMSGTSMAAPVVSGVMGLMFAANPKLTANEAISKLYSTAKDLTKSYGTNGSWDRATGFGEVNAAAAVASGRPYLSGDVNVQVGSSKTMSVKVAGVKKAASGWKWKTSDSSIATVNAAGKVTGKRSGRVAITAVKGSLRARQIVTVHAYPKAFKVSLSKTKYTYSSSACKPVPTVRCGTTVLKRGRDYTVSYSKNVNAGTATVSVRGLGTYYACSATKKFTIAKASLSKASVRLSAKTLAYTGKVRKPLVSVYDKGKNKKVKLRSGAHYKVKGAAVVRGTGKLKITATSTCRNYKGSVVRTFRVQ